MQPLNANPRRQAVASLQGYSFQIWHSLLGWFNLDSGEELFLEGAEDIDLLGPETAETVQVKKLSAPVTLRSSSILDAINNYWQHRQSNPRTKISYRFLTTAARALEQERPFANENGLDVWDRAKSPGVATESIRAYLTSLSGISDSVKAFLTESSPDEFRRDFICRIEWDTGCENQEFLEEIINRKVVEFGERVFNLPPSESRKVVPHLLSHVWETVLKPAERVLRKRDLSEIFEKATMALIPKVELETLRYLASGRPTPVGGAIGRINETGVLPLTGGVIETFSAPSMGNFVNRDHLVETGSRNLNATGVLILTGMTGMGKSILGSQIISGLAGEWVTVSFRGLSAEEIDGRLDLISRRLEDSSNQTGFLLDDLNFDQHINRYERRVEKVLYLLSIRHARVIFTSQNRIPASIIHNCDIKPNSIVKMPLMVFDEIETLAQIHGADPKTAKRWTPLIAAQTGSHPALVHARIRGLQFRNWTAPPVTELFKSDDVDEVRQEFRRTLDDTLPLDARNLLYRLSIFFGRFNRRQALDLASRKPPIALAGEVFDRLIGPWVEPEGREHFRLSPLVSDAADKVFATKENKKLHSAAASSYLQEKSITPQDANSILMHGIRGENPFPMMVLLPKLLGIEPEYKDSVYELLSWFPLVKVGNGQTFFKGFMMANTFIRQLQFAIQSHLHPEKVMPIVERWEQELNDPEGPGDIPGTSLGHRFTFLMDLLIYTNAKLKPEDIARYLIELNVILRRDAKLAPTIPEYDSQFWGAFKGLDDIAIFLGASVARFRNGGDIVRMLVALREADDTLTQEIWEAFDADVHLTTLAVDRLWLNEAARESPDWQNCLQNLDLISGIGIAEGVFALPAAALRAKAIVFEEYLKDSDAALEMLGQAEQTVGPSHPLIDEYRARLFLFRKEYGEALDLLDKIINQTGGAPPGRYVVYRDAEMCAAHLGRWSDAADYAAKGIIAALQSGEGSVENAEETAAFAMTFQADRAYCLWKAGAQSAAIKEFRNILEQFERLSSIETDLRARMLYQRVGYAIGWLVSGEKIRKNFGFEPQSGWFSDFTIDKNIADVSKLPIDHYWILLAELEIKRKLGATVLDELFKKELPPNRIPVLWLLKFRDEILNPDARRLPESIFQLAAGIGSDPSNANNSEPEFLIGMLFPYLIAIVAKERSLLDIPVWKKDLEDRGSLTPAVAEWLVHVDEIFSMEVFHLSNCLKDTEQPANRRLLASLALSLSLDVDPETLLYAHVILVTNPSVRVWRDVMGDVMENRIVCAWENVATNHRFRLISPGSTAPEILRACEDDSRNGFEKAANVLVAATLAVKLRFDETLMNDLRSLSRGEGEFSENSDQASSVATAN